MRPLRTGTGCRSGVSSCRSTQNQCHPQSAPLRSGQCGPRLCATPGRSSTIVAQAAVSDLPADPAPPSSTTSSSSHDAEVVIIGSGIGGLCCGALLAYYGHAVTIVESHYAPGGVAHVFDVGGYKFDAGPSFHAGLSSEEGQASNPLKQVLDVIGESIQCVQYDRWVVHAPDATFECVADGPQYREMIRTQGGEAALSQWLELEKRMAPLQQGAALLPAFALRSDLGLALTAGRMGPALALAGLQAGVLTGPFSAVVDKVVTDPWLRRFIDLECFVLSGMTAKDTICAEMAFMFMERNQDSTTLDYPLGGCEAAVQALIRGLEKRGGRLLLSSHVEQVLLEDGRAAGVRLRPKAGQPADVIRASKAVISNASVWDTQHLLPEGAAPREWKAAAEDTPECGSFMHLHLGFDCAGLDLDAIEGHHLVVNSWEDVEAPQNVCILCIASVFDRTGLAPAGKGVLHAYTAGNEPYSLWAGMDRKSEAYKALKVERSRVLWETVERVIPDIRQRVEVEMVGSPLTHERWNRRHRGTYGAAVSASDSAFPYPPSPIPGLYGCGDSYQPGIGVPAAAASGMMCANTIASVWDHLKMMKALGK